MRLLPRASRAPTTPVSGGAGTPSGYAATHTAFRHAWWTYAGVALPAALVAPATTPRRTAAPVAPPAVPAAG
ncbi:hypothetical protein [Jatrophihabitans fulvus]